MVLLTSLTGEILEQIVSLSLCQRKVMKSLSQTVMYIHNILMGVDDYDWVHTA